MHLRRPSCGQARGNRFVAKPFFPHGFPHQRAHARRIGSASDRDQIDFAPELRLNHGQRDDAGMPSGIFRHEGKAKSRRNHGQGPIVAFTPVGRRACHAFFLEDMVGVAGEFAIHPVNIRFAIELPDRKSTFAGETMTAMNCDDHLLLKQRHHVRALIELFARQRVDDDFEVAGKQAIPQAPGRLHRRAAVRARRGAASEPRSARQFRPAISCS